MKNIFTEHPKSVGESYKTYVSSNIKKLHDDIFLNRLNK